MDRSAVSRRQTDIEIETPPGFRLIPTATGHGWYDLPPFEFARDGSLSLLHVLSEDEVIAIRVRETAGHRRLLVSVQTTGTDDGNSEAAQAAACTVVRDILAFDVDLEPFYRRTDSDPGFRWVRAAGAGRLLRAPTVYEDLVKLICTTNCTWSSTRRMVSALILHLGSIGPGGRRAFPTPPRMAAEPESFYREVVRAGYRAPALHELALRAAREPEALERLRRVDWAGDTLRRALLELRGVGPYAAEQMVRLLGRHEYLAVDSWCLAKFAALRGRKRPATPRALARAYARYGEYKGLALWLDLTRDWPCYGPEGRDSGSAG